MREMLQKVFPFKRKTRSLPRKGRQKSRGQSLVEMAISLPVILTLFSGLVELGFMLNYYLSLLDATRYAARQYADQSPFVPNTTTDDMKFYYNHANPTMPGAAGDVEMILSPFNSLDNTRKVKPDPAHDDVIVSVYSVYSSSHIVRYPDPAVYPNGYYLYGDHTHGNGNASAFKMEDLSAQIAALEANNVAHGLPSPPCQGILVVEIAYTYHQVLGLPWMAGLGSPVLHAYSVFPLQVAQPNCP